MSDEGNRRVRSHPPHPKPDVVNPTRARTKADRIARLRQRLDNARTEKDLRDVLKGVLDLLADEL